MRWVIKTIAIIPIKKNSQRVPGKNFKKINGKPLYKYLLDNNALFNSTLTEEFSKFRQKFRDNWCKKENNWQEIFIRNKTLDVFEISSLFLIFLGFS